MSENYILVKNVNQQNLERILMDLANLYSETEFVNGIQLYREKGNYDSFLILFSVQPDFERFNYFVNYINYPKGYDKFSPKLSGYYQTSQINETYEFNYGEWLMIYVSKTDTAFDNVHVVNSKDESFLYDFGGKIKKLSTTEVPFKWTAINQDNYHHIIAIYSSKSFEQSEPKAWWKFW